MPIETVVDVLRDANVVAPRIGVAAENVYEAFPNPLHAAAERRDRANKIYWNFSAAPFSLGRFFLMM